MGLLSGLNALGLGNLEDADLFDKKQAAEDEENGSKPYEIKEEDLLFDKTYTCTICDHEFKTKTVRANKSHFLGTDMDLRPKYEGIDMLKYDTVVCPACGYAALTRYFKYVTGAQSKLIQTNICANFKGRKKEGNVYTYEQALERYKLVLANAIVKRAHASEKAYICLKTGWLLRGMIETMEEDEHDQGYLFKKSTLEKQEKEYMQNALEGFISARETEGFPMCGMDEATVDYLIAVLAMDLGQYDLSMKILGSLLTSSTANSRTKDKVRDVKDVLLQRMKEAKRGEGQT